MSNNKIFFLSGIPRSGSTLLGSILSQNPNVYVTATSNLGMLLNDVDELWKKSHVLKHRSTEEHRINVKSAILTSYHKHINKKIIIDKGRQWPEHLNLLKIALKRKPKIIATVRDIPEVLASFYSIFEKTNPGFLNNILKQNKINDSKYNICRLLWGKSPVGISGTNNMLNVFEPWKSLRLGYLGELKDCIHIVEYNDILNNPKKTLKKIYDFLEVENFNKHTFNNLKNAIPEDDANIYGIPGLHDIKPVLKKYSLPANKVIGEEAYTYFRNLNLEFWKS